MSNPVTKETLSPKELARRWDVHPNTLANMRHRGDGPVYFKWLNSIRYRVRDIEAFEAAYLQTSTAQNKAAKRPKNGR